MNWLYDERALRAQGEWALAGLANGFLEEREAEREIGAVAEKRR
jgi:hypothetical protein